MKHWQDYVLPDNNLFPEQYTVLEILRESQTSSVLIAFDNQLGCKVIIKCFKQAAKGAYLREISAVYDLKHNHLARCLNTFNRTDGHSCLVYEYLIGGSLADLIESAGVLSVDLVFHCLNDILKALIYLHALNRIHCDIKPGNIFLRPKANGQFEYVLGDLGAACFLREAQEGHHVTGTPAYIAPERIRNQFFFNSDLYSLGVVAFELCTGYRPFMGSVEEITQCVLSQIPSLEAIEYQPLRDLIDHLLIKSPQKRIETASLVYFYLNKLQKQYENACSTVKMPPFLQQNKSDCSLSLKQSGQRQQLKLTTGDNLLAIQCFHADERILIGLTYSGYTDIIDPKYPDDVLKTLTNTHSIQVTGSASITYATPSRIQQLDLNRMVSTLLIEKINNPKKFYFYNNTLLFTDDFNVYFYNLNDGSNFCFRSPSYLFDPKISVFENGSFCISEGMANEKLVKRDSTGAILSEWMLDGPLVAMTRRIDNIILGASLSIKDQNKYSIWCLHEFEEIKKWVLTEKVKQISCTENAIFWLTQNAELYCCDAGLQHKMIGNFTQTTTKFAVSFDGLYIAMLDLVGRNQAIVTIFNNRES
ncbi:serine/threonine-protein kinase [Methyloglobulus sp.]|uniref:serine/threonine protein kinase n=1 Tax=Methyloglobulus sp. TaxID=2518622 RepID=UPI0032B82E69